MFTRFKCSNCGTESIGIQPVCGKCGAQMMLKCCVCSLELPVSRFYRNSSGNYICPKCFNVQETDQTILICPGCLEQLKMTGDRTREQVKWGGWTCATCGFEVTSVWKKDKTCPQCRAVIPQYSLVCPVCSHPFTSRDVSDRLAFHNSLHPVQSIRYDMSPKMAPLDPVKKRKSRSIIGWVLTALGVLFLIIFILGYLFPTEEQLKTSNQLTIGGMIGGLSITALPCLIAGVLFLRKAGKVKREVESDRDVDV